MDLFYIFSFVIQLKLTLRQIGFQMCRTESIRVRVRNIHDVDSLSGDPNHCVFKPRMMINMSDEVYERTVNSNRPI